MIKMSKTTKTDMKAKGLSIYEGKIVDDGEVIDLVNLLENLYGDAPFDFSVTRSINEEIEEPVSEFDPDADEY